jgi:hypothetical protein
MSSQRTDNWTKSVVFELYTFWFIGKVFTYIAAPLLVAWFLTRPDPLSGLSWALLLSIMYGIWETVYGILAGHDPITALQILVFNLCPLYLFPGLWAGARRPGLVRGYIRFNVWFCIIYTPIYFIFLSKLNSELVPSPGSSSLLILGLVCFESGLVGLWLPMIVCTFTAIANEIRGDWAGLGIALVVWAAVTKRLGRLLSMAGIVFALLLIGFVADVRLPALPGRGGEISARDTIGRALSSVNPELAHEYSSNSADYAGTVYWRQVWWKGIRDAVSEHRHTLIFGLGYGYPLKQLATSDVRKSGDDIRTPHSVLYFTLAYSGCVGLLLFFILQATVLGVLWRTYKETGQIFGLVSHLAMLVAACFGNILESPQRAIPWYLLVGMCIGPLFRERYGLEARPDWETAPPARMKMGRFAPGRRMAQQVLIPSRFVAGGKAEL